MSDTFDKAFSERDFQKPLQTVRELLDGSLMLRVNVIPMLAELLTHCGLQEAGCMVRQIMNLLEEIDEAQFRADQPQKAPPCEWCAKYRKYKLEDLLPRPLGPGDLPEDPTQLRPEFAEAVNEMMASGGTVPADKPGDDYWLAVLNGMPVGTEPPAIKEGNPCIGSSFEDWLAEEGIQETVDAEASKRLANYLNQCSEEDRLQLPCGGVELPPEPICPSGTSVWDGERFVPEWMHGLPRFPGTKREFFDELRQAREEWDRQGDDEAIQKEWDAKWDHLYLQQPESHDGPAG
jgi:hypothetical protein